MAMVMKRCEPGEQVQIGESIVTIRKVGDRRVEIAVEAPPDVKVSRTKPGKAQISNPVE